MKKKMIIKIFIVVGICFLFLVLYQCYQSRIKSNLTSAAVKEKVIGEKEEMKKIAITFDDGPHPYYTEQLLDGLNKRGVKATFFVTGEHAELHPEIIKRMYEDA